MKLGLEGGLRAKSRGTPEDEKSAEGWTKRSSVARTVDANVELTHVLTQD
jgi:hypothetical protein